jgi:hypothetical protein
MAKNITTLFFFFLFWISIVPAWAEISLPELTIFYSNDVRGEIEPCG